MKQEVLRFKQNKFILPDKCLVVMPDYIGDCVLLTSFLRNLKYNLKENSQLHISATKPIAQMLSTIDYVDSIFVKENIKDINKFLKNQNYDTAIILDYSLKWQFNICTSSIKQKVVSDLKRLYENSHIIFNKFFTTVLENTPINDKTPQIDVYSGFLEQLGLNIFDKKIDLPITPEDKKYAKKLIKKNEKRKIFIHTGASILSKQWPKEYWEKVLKEIKDDEIYMIGSEHPPKSLLKSNIINLCCKTNLRQTIALLSHADILLTTDSAPAHLASVAQTPNILVLYGPTNYHQWKPHATNSNIVQIHANVPCNPCKMRTCQSLRCLKELTPQMVISELNKIN